MAPHVVRRHGASPKPQAATRGTSFMRLTPGLRRPLAVLTVLAFLVVPRPVSAAERVVYLVGELADEDLLTLTSAVAAGDAAPVVLLDTPGAGSYLKGFLAAYRPDRVVP